MTTTEQRIRKLASKLDQEDMAVLGSLLQKVAADSAYAGATAKDNQEVELQKLATDLVAQGYNDDEIVAAVEKIAEHQKTAAECQGITNDIVAMGTMMGKQAMGIQMSHADEYATYIGKKAAAVHIQELQNFVKAAEEEEEEEEEKKEDSSSKMPPQLRKRTRSGQGEEEGEEEEEKQAANRRVALLKAILEGTGLENAAQ